MGHMARGIVAYYREGEACDLPILPCLGRLGLVFAFVLFGFGIEVSANAQSNEGLVQKASLEATPPAQWVDIVKPLEFFGIEAPELAAATKTYQARRHSLGGRQDTISFGSLNGEKLYLRLTAYRPGAEAASASQSTFFVDLVRNAAQAGLSIGRSLLPQLEMTRFGLFQVADLDLVDHDGVATACLGFRSAPGESILRFNGFACGAKGRPLSRPALVCLVERLDLTGAAEDRELAKFFANAEPKRDPACAKTTPKMALAQANWLDQVDASPPLRGKKKR